MDELPDISENSDDEWNFEHRKRSNLASIKKHCENSQSPEQLSQTLNHSISCLQKERDQLMEKFEKCRDKYKKAEILHRSYRREKERALEEYNSAYSEGKNVKGKHRCRKYFFPLVRKICPKNYFTVCHISEFTISKKPTLS